MSVPVDGSGAKLPRPFSAAVLAGGRSTRMGTDKAFLRIGDELLLDRQLRCLHEAGAAELLISGRAGVDYSQFVAKVVARVVYDQQLNAGPLAGLGAALRASSCPLVLVLAVDLPAISAAMLSKIVSRCGEDSGCVPVDDNGFQPLAAAYPTSLLALAERQLQSANYSMRKFVRQAIGAGLVRPLRLEAAEQIHFINWNQPSDWIDVPT